LFETDRHGHNKKQHSSTAMPQFLSVSILSIEKGILEWKKIYWNVLRKHWEKTVSCHHVIGILKR